MSRGSWWASSSHPSGRLNSRALPGRWAPSRTAAVAGTSAVVAAAARSTPPADAAAGPGTQLRPRLLPLVVAAAVVAATRPLAALRPTDSNVTRPIVDAGTLVTSLESPPIKSNKNHSDKLNFTLKMFQKSVHTMLRSSEGWIILLAALEVAMTLTFGSLP